MAYQYLGLAHLGHAIAAKRLDAAGVLIGRQKAHQLQRQLLQFLKGRGEARNHVGVPQTREEQRAPRHRKVRQSAHEIETVLLDQRVEIATQSLDLKKREGGREVDRNMKEKCKKQSESHCERCGE
jgi:hypothetical protein